MDPREIVRRTLDYDDPERVARSFLPESDFAGAGCRAKTHATEWKEVGGGRWERLDEWGNTWARVDPTSKGEVVSGVLDDLEDISGLERYEFPDYSRPEDYQSAREARGKHADKWLLGGMPGFAFNIARKLRKLDQYLVDLMIERELMHELHDRIDRILEDMIRNYAAAGVDAVMFPEDWGTQATLMISPELWREEFGPRFKKLCAVARECGTRVFMHSCGRMTAIVPDLIEAGIACLQFDQPTLHGIDDLARLQEKGRITFWCPVDIQKTLQSKDEALIRAEAREMLDKLWSGRDGRNGGGTGGFIAGFYGDETSIGLEPEWQAAAADEFLRRGVMGG